MKTVHRVIATTLIVASMMTAIPTIEYNANTNLISTTAYASNYSYSEADLNNFITAHDQFIKSHGKNAYLYCVTNDKSTKRYVLEFQRSANFLADQLGISDSTPEDSYYGNDCKSLCKKIQKKLKCDADGYCGNQTYQAFVKKLKELINDADVSNQSFTSTIDPVANAADIFIQQTPSHCTAAAAAMLLKNYERINGHSDWSGISELTFRTGSASPSDTWNYGLLLSIKLNRPGKSYDGVKLKAYSLTGTSAQKEEKIKNLLSSHPEGLVLYGIVGDACHAVYISKDMLILDPYFSTPKYRKLSQSANSCSDSWSDIQQYWLVVH